MSAEKQTCTKNRKALLSDLWERTEGQMCAAHVSNKFDVARNFDLDGVSCVTDLTWEQTWNLLRPSRPAVV